jgi:hypothetical protein
MKLTERASQQSESNNGVLTYKINAIIIFLLAKHYLFGLLKNLLFFAPQHIE